MVHQRGLGVKFLCHDDRLDRRLDLGLLVVALVDHVGDLRHLAAVGGKEMDFVEDAEDLVGVDRAERQVVIGVFAVVEVEAAEHVLVEEPRHDLLDVDRVVVVAGVDEHLGARASLLGIEERHAPGEACCAGS